MSERQWRRWDVLERLEKGKLTTGEAARILQLSTRQVRRLREEMRAGGRQALIHGNRGRSPANRTEEAVRKRIVSLRLGKYAGKINDEHFTEKLSEEKDPAIEVPVRTVRRILRGAGIRACRRRRPRRHRKRRERKAREGLMLLWDGSLHDWLEGRGPSLCLMAAMDDATGTVLPGAHFVTRESSAGYLRVLRDLVRAQGIPCMIYMDQHSSLRRNDDWWTLAEELRGRQDPTQVGRALETLGIEAIYALSAQAKGRVERLWGTLQDRLVTELRLAGASTVEEANTVLEAYLPVHNEKFSVPPRETESMWRPLRKSVDLDRVCSFAYEATVGRDNAVRIAGLVFDIPPGPKNRSYANKRVEVRQILDGSWRIYDDQDRLIATGPVTHHGELRTFRRRKHSRGAPVSPPTHATYIEVRI